MPTTSKVCTSQKMYSQNLYLAKQTLEINCKRTIRRNLHNMWELCRQGVVYLSRDLNPSTPSRICTTKHRNERNLLRQDAPLLLMHEKRRPATELSLGRSSFFDVPTTLIRTLNSDGREPVRHGISITNLWGSHKTIVVGWEIGEMRKNLLSVYNQQLKAEEIKSHT